MKRVINLSYIDESGFSEYMPRTHGYAKKGQRCFDISHYTNKKRTHVIGALSDHQLLQIQTFQTPINSHHFKSFMQDLLPTLDKPSVIVMDNASFHKKKDIIELIQHSVHTLEFLPVYSPDLNPIEHTWAYFKHIRKKTSCSIDHLFSDSHICAQPFLV